MTDSYSGNFGVVLFLLSLRWLLFASKVQFWRPFCLALYVFDEMSQKRNPDDSSGKLNLGGNHIHSPDDKRRKSLRSFRSVVLEVMTQMRFEKFQKSLEPMLRKIVKEEVELAIRKHVVCLTRPCKEDVFPSEAKSLRLKFLSTFSLPVYTGTRIDGDDGSGIKVALVDAFTNEVLQYAPESSAKVEVVVLEGNFDGDEEEKWTVEEFNNNVIAERKGKKPLLTGDVYLVLEKGIGFVRELSFTDNSSWTRSRRFRLGARVVGNLDGARIREAKSESFTVKDHRGELYKKHHPPSLSDEVWRLEKIGKHGAFHERLSTANVNTVKDFLTLLHLDPERLRSILGSGMSTKRWEVTVEHARTCAVGERVFLYYSPTSQRKRGVVFNVLGQVMGIYSERNYVPIDKMSENDKINAQEIVRETSPNWDGVISFEDLNSLLRFSPDLLNDCAEPSVPSLASMFSRGYVSSAEDFSLEAVDSNLDLRFDDPLDSLLLDIDNDNQHLGFLDVDCSFQATNPSLESNPHSSAHTIRRPARRRWRVLSSVVRWLMIRTDRRETGR